jgi:hypothetical protein
MRSFIICILHGLGILFSWENLMGGGHSGEGKILKMDSK